MGVVISAQWLCRGPSKNDYQHLPPALADLSQVGESVCRNHWAEHDPTHLSKTEVDPLAEPRGRGLLLRPVVARRSSLFDVLSPRSDIFTNFWGKGAEAAVQFPMRLFTSSHRLFVF